MDDESIEQAVRQGGLLTEEQIEQVREAVGRAADQDEDLSFLDAAVREKVLTEYQAEDIRKQAEREISTSETEDISEAIPAGLPEAEEAPPTSEADAADETGEPESDEDAAATQELPEPADAPETEGEALAAADKLSPLPIVIGIAALIILIILVAILNRPPG
jgi:hypothetical protein